MKVKRRRGESIEAFMARFKRMVNNSGITQDIKKRECYVKPSELRNRANESRKFRNRKRAENAERSRIAEKHRKRVGRYKY